jgi:2-polyprenyl-3-methyl-5-hydroxy-6-metoxy-1,4-benzoquinol methylase
MLERGKNKMHKNLSEGEKIKTKENLYLIDGVARYHNKPIDMLSLNRTAAWKTDIADKQRKMSRLLYGKRISLSACPICKSKRHEIFVKVFGYAFHQCNSCGHIFSKTPPKSSAIKDLYASNNNPGKIKAVQAEIYARKELYDKRVKNIALPKLKFITKRIRPGGKWIDIGAGVGEIIKAATLLGWDASGLESDATEISFARLMGIKLTNVFIDRQDLSRYVKDARVVSLFNVLEHVPSPCDFMSVLSKNMRKGAKLVIEAPRHPSISSFSNSVFPEYAARHIYPPDHLHIFTERSLAIVLEKNHFKIEVIWLFGQDIFEAFSSMAIKRKYQNYPNQELFRQVLSAVNDIQKSIDMNELSDAMIMIATKQ